MSQRNSFLKASCGCNIERALHHDEAYIFITGAQKQSDMPGGKSYIAYHIRIGVSPVRKLLCDLSNEYTILTNTLAI